MALHKPSGNWRLGLLLATITTLSWGALPLALKITLTQLDAVTLMWFRFLVSGVMLVVALGARRKVPAFHRAGWRGLMLLVLATLGLAANYYYYQLGLDHTSPGTAQVLIQISPLMFMISSLFIFHERFAKLQVLGLGVLLLGFGLFFCNRFAELFAALNSYNLGLLYILIAAVSWAIYALAQKQLLTVFASPAIMLFIYLGSALLVTPMTTPSLLTHLNHLTFALLIFCALNTVVGYGAFAEALRHWEASRVSAVLALSPLITLALIFVCAQFWPQFVAPEGLGWLSYAGAFMVVLGSVLVALGQWRRGAVRAETKVGFTKNNC